MIEPTQLSLHQNIAFLVKSDLAQHDVMQSLARQVAREFAMDSLGHRWKLGIDRCYRCSASTALPAGIKARFAEVWFG